MNTFEKLKTLIEKQFIFDGELSMDTKLVEDLGADSFDTINFVCIIEDQFETNLPEAELADIETVGDIVRCIDKSMEMIS